MRRSARLQEQAHVQFQESVQRLAGVPSHRRHPARAQNYSLRPRPGPGADADRLALGVVFTGTTFFDRPLHYAEPPECILFVEYHRTVGLIFPVNVRGFTPNVV